MEVAELAELMRDGFDELGGRVSQVRDETTRAAAGIEAIRATCAERRSGCSREFQSVAERVVGLEKAQRQQIARHAEVSTTVKVFAGAGGAIALSLLGYLLSSLVGCG